MVLVLAGIIIGGSKVMSTVGEGIAELDGTIVTISLLTSSAAIITANWLKTPVSSHQAIVASLVGSALALGKPVDLSTITKIVISWIVSPFGALLMAVSIYWLMEQFISKLPMLKIERILRILLLIAGSVIAFNTGANELATALGPAVYYGVLTPIQAGVVGAVMLFLGARLVSMRVVETVGKGITSLDPYSGFAAQFGAGLTVLFFTVIGMPVSTSYCIVGAITGVGLYKSLRGVRFAFLKRIMASWFLTPTIAMMVSYLFTSSVI
jgi:PiT family inorganic phosphate transporter